MSQSSCAAVYMTVSSSETKCGEWSWVVPTPFLWRVCSYTNYEWLGADRQKAAQDSSWEMMLAWIKLYKNEELTGTRDVEEIKWLLDASDTGDKGKDSIRIVRFLKRQAWTPGWMKVPFTEVDAVGWLVLSPDVYMLEPVVMTLFG